MIALLFAAVTTATTPDPAPPPTTPPAAVQPAAPPKARKICVEDDTMGSLFKKRTCHTKAEWLLINEREGRKAQEALDFKTEERAH